MKAAGAAQGRSTAARGELTPAAWRRLAQAAERARRRAYAPYSDYRVGAAIQTTRSVVLGCNVENASYPLCVCAEAAAVAHAVTLGETRWKAMAVATQGPEPGAPCGACRQIIAEFASDLPIALVVGGRVIEVVSIRDLLPQAFNSRVLAASVRKR